MMQLGITFSSTNTRMKETTLSPQVRVAYHIIKFIYTLWIQNNVFVLCNYYINTLK